MKSPGHLRSKAKKRKHLSPFKVGTIFNPLKKNIQGLDVPLGEVQIKFPSRLNAMALDPSGIAMKKNHIYTPGEIVFPIGIYKNIVLSSRKDDLLTVHGDGVRRSLVLHSFLLMKKAIGFRSGFDIKISTSELVHSGLGSSSGLIAVVASAINEAYKNPIPKEELVRYLAQNHGEEIDGEEEYLYPVQCIGGSAAAGLCNAGLIVLTGESSLVAKMKISHSYSVILGVPKDFKEQDSKTLMDKEVKNLHKFVKTGKKFGPLIAYEMLHKVLPAILRGSLKEVGDLIFEYRFKMGSIKNCSYSYKKLPGLCDRLAFLKLRSIADVFSISSVGPTVFAISKDPRECLKAFQKEKLNTRVTTIANDGYIILGKNEE